MPAEATPGAKWFPYIAVPGASIAPGVPIALVRQDGTMTARVRALVDSGCSSTTFPAEWAAELGIDWDECTPIQGITASGADDPDDDADWPRVWPPGVDAVFWGKKIHLSAMFRVNLVPILLGRDDFFAHYKVLFDHREHRFSLAPYDK